MNTSIWPLAVLVLGNLVSGGLVLRADILEPTPKGCLYFSVEEAADNEQAVRNKDGQITAVVTPTKRTELLRRRWTRTEFESAINEIEAKRQTDPLCRADFRIPVGAAWKALQTIIEPEDEIWTFGSLDAGTVVIRENRVVCLVVTEHQY